MDFEKVLNVLINRFDSEKIHYALTGGYALGALGIVRATVDLDILVDKDDLSKIDKIMSELGYKLRFRTENVSQYASSLKVWGEVDFLHAFRKASKRMLSSSIKKPVFGGKFYINILRPEDIIGLKVQGIANNPSRRARDLEDIKEIMKKFGKKLDWPLLDEYFSLFQMKKLYEELKKEYGKID